MESLSWITVLLTEFNIIAIDYRIRAFIIRIAWAFVIVKYQSLSFFVEKLAHKHRTLPLIQKILLPINTLFCVFFLVVAFVRFNATFSALDRSSLEYFFMKGSAAYVSGILLVSIFATIRQLRNTPKILGKQLKIFIYGILSPFLMLEGIQAYCMQKSVTSGIIICTINSISTLLISYAFYFCTKKVMNLRFLNFHNHVEEPKKYSFIDDFKETLEKLSYTTNTKELVHITKAFFKDSLQIPTGRTILHIRKLGLGIENEEMTPPISPSARITTIEQFITSDAGQSMTDKIFMYDELEFSNFYEENPKQTEALTLLKKINANIFIPIYQKERIIAYIIVEQDTQSHKLYSNIKRDEMVVFASYLGNVINLLQTKNLNILVQREKEMKEELHSKHQEINQYKESMRQFLKNSKQHRIGILFYKNRRFIIANEEAKELLPIDNINLQEGHALSRKLRDLARRVEKYKSPQSCLYEDSEGTKLVLNAIANLEYNNVIITIQYPEISDIIKGHIDHLKDPSAWDYVLYLETTKSGQLINQLIPGTGETLINFKIELLKLALSKKAIVLDMPEDDLQATVEIIHHISLGDQLHTLNLQGPSITFDTAIKLFGINDMLGQQAEQPLLQQLAQNGTIFIKNIHFMRLETQEYLAEYIRYGFYHVFKSDLKKISNARIICSTNQDLKALVHEGKFSQNLYNELNKASLKLPGLMTMSMRELETLTQGFTQQAIKKSTFKNLLELSDTDKRRLMDRRPVSLHEFKLKVRQLLVEKSKKTSVYEETTFDPAYEITDPQLADAARLGKHALRDKQMMTLLWNKFKNQNKIAAFLGVNRSSINRRCKEFGLV